MHVILRILKILKVVYMEVQGLFSSKEHLLYCRGSILCSQKLHGDSQNMCNYSSGEMQCSLLAAMSTANQWSTYTQAKHSDT